MREDELKLRVGDGYVLPDLAAAVPEVQSVGPLLQHELRADYVDTADLRLARSGVTLRRRVGGSDDGWHLKLPRPSKSSGPLSREELHLPLLGTDEVPPRFAELVTAWARRSPLEPVATLLTQRTVHPLAGADGQLLAELTDDVVTLLQQDRETSRFREVEVEDRGGGTALLIALGEVLVAYGAVRDEQLPKVVRALGPAALAEPELPAPFEVRPRDPAAQAVASSLRRHVGALVVQDPRVRLHEDDAVHQIRVACRRLRSALKTYRPLLDSAWAEDLRDELRWLATSLGAARDAEVLQERLLAALDDLEDEEVATAGRAGLQGVLAAKVAQGEAEAVEALRSDRYLDLLDRLVDAARLPVTAPGAQDKAKAALRPLVAKAWRRLANSADIACRPGSTDESLHDMRIAAKAARYAAEDVVPVFGAAAAALGKQAEAVQTLLGAQHDAVVAADAVRELARSVRSPRTAFALGVLQERQRAAAAVDRDALLAVWEQAHRSKHRQWLTG